MIKPMRESIKDLTNFNRTISIFVEMIDDDGELVIVQQIYLIVGYDYTTKEFIAEYIGDGMDIVLN